MSGARTAPTAGAAVPEGGSGAAATTARARRVAGGSVLLGLIPLVAVVAVVLAQAPRGTAGAELTTSLISGVLWAVAAVASTACVGALCYGAFLRTRTGRGRLEADRAVDYTAVRWSALVWTAAAAALIPVDAVQTAGRPLSALVDPAGMGALSHLVGASGLALAWCVVVVLAGCVLIGSFVARTWASLLGLLMLAGVAVLCPLLVSQVLIGPNHDFGGDATVIGAPAAAILLGTTWMVAVRAHGPHSADAQTLRRFRAVSGWCWMLLVGSQLVVCAFELAGTPVWGSATGRMFLAQFALLAAMAAVAAPALRRWRDPASAGRLARAPLTVVLPTLMAGYLAVDVMRSRVAPPQYSVHTSVMQSFFGYNVTTPPTWTALELDWRPSILFLAISVAAMALYLFGVIRLHRRGDAWSIGRTLAWLFGWIVIIVTTSSGLGVHANATFSAQMALHMSLNMFGPVLIVLGGPVTLALRATAAHPSGEAAGPHEWVTALLKWDIAERMYNPLGVFIRFVGSYYLLYVTPLFGMAIRYHWARDLMNLEFIAAGYMFFGMVIGVDHVPRPLPHIGRLGLTMAAMPIHAFFGVIVMMSTHLIAGDFYRLIHAPLLTTLYGDQQIAGGIAWSAGEIPLAFVVIVLALQWARQDEREAKRMDRRISMGIDDGYEAYNEMLAKLAARDQHAGAVPAASERE